MNAQWFRTKEAIGNADVIVDRIFSKCGDYTKKFLENWKGTYLHCDGYTGYKKLMDKTYADTLYMQSESFMKHTKLIGVMNIQNKEKLILESYFNWKLKLMKLSFH